MDNRDVALMHFLLNNVGDNLDEETLNQHMRAFDAGIAAARAPVAAPSRAVTQPLRAGAAHPSPRHTPRPAAARGDDAPVMRRRHPLVSLFRAMCYLATLVLALLAIGAIAEKVANTFFNHSLRNDAKVFIATRLGYGLQPGETEHVTFHNGIVTMYSYANCAPLFQAVDNEPPTKESTWITPPIGWPKDRADEFLASQRSGCLSYLDRDFSIEAHAKDSTWAVVRLTPQQSQERSAVENVWRWVDMREWGADAAKVKYYAPFEVTYDDQGYAKINANEQAHITIVADNAGGLTPATTPTPLPNNTPLGSDPNRLTTGGGGGGDNGGAVPTTTNIPFRLPSVTPVPSPTPTAAEPTKFWSPADLTAFAIADATSTVAALQPTWDAQNAKHTAEENAAAKATADAFVNTTPIVQPEFRDKIIAACADPAAVAKSAYLQLWCKNAPQATAATDDGCMTVL